MQDKNKNKLMRESFSRFVDYKTALHFFYQKHFNKQRQPDIIQGRNNFWYEKELKEKINITNRRLA